ncbi:MAG: DUF2157 domain-containing protein [bacterium]|nr:DUF2157 domain-containing protein [bacterium]
MKMEKNELLKYIEQLAEKGQLSKQELLAAFYAGTGEDKIKKIFNNLSFSKVLYYIGGGIVVLGISVLVGQNWDTLNTFTKIISTLGVSIAVYFSGLILCSYRDHEVLGQTFLFISALVAPIGLYVLFDSTGFTASSMPVQTAIYLILTVWLLMSFLKFRKVVLLIFTIVFSSYMFVSLNFLIAMGSPFLETILYYDLLIIGLSAIFLGYYMTKTDFSGLSGLLYAAGAFFFLLEAFVLCGYPPDNNRLWEILFPLLIFGLDYLSVLIKSKSILILSSIFLVIYILNITSGYFSGSIGWPLALMVTGFLLIIIGYFTFYLNKKYLKQ